MKSRTLISEIQQVQPTQAIPRRVITIPSQGDMALDRAVISLAGAVGYQ